jgi:hypothetical protein
MIDLTSPADWDWVAIGTLALAAATFYLALSNRKIVATSQEQLKASQRDLELAREQNETAREALEAQTAPLLANVPWGLERKATRYLPTTGEEMDFKDSSRVTVSQVTHRDEPRVEISVPFRNVGNGVAIITSVQVMIGGLLFDGVPSVPVLPPSELAIAHVDAGRADPVFDRGLSLGLEGVDFAVIVGYGDAAGNPRGAISLDVHRENPGSDVWRVRQLHMGDTAEAALNHPSLSSLPL